MTLQITTGSPVARVTILTDTMKFRITTEIGNANSDILSITTNKDLGNPAGSFSINFVPRKDDKGYTWFDKLDAYDYVQIELKGINDPDFAVVMRGIIDTVNKSESWDGGTPNRVITVSGRDFGCLLTDHQIAYVPELGQDQALEGMLTYLAWKNFIPGNVNAQTAFDTIWDRFEFSLDLEVGAGSNRWSATGEAERLGEQVKQKFGRKAEAFFPDDKTNLWHLKGYEGSYWNAFAQYQDKPWHELFVYDVPKESSGAYLILRPSKLKDAKGNYHKSVNDLLSNALMYPPDFKFYSRDLISMNVSKSQAEVFNYFLTIPALQLLTKIAWRGFCLSTNKGDFTKSENPYFQSSNFYPAYMGKYGVRKYEATTYFINLDVGQLEKKESNKQLQYETEVAAPAFLKKGVERTRTLVAWFLHNEFLLSGNIDIAGTNQAIVGTYAQHWDDPASMEYYTEGVSHSWVLFQSFRTSLRVTRGQPSKDAGGLVGVSEVNDMRMNRYYFGGDGVKDVYGPVTIKFAKPKKDKGKSIKKLVVQEIPLAAGHEIPLASGHGRTKPVFDIDEGGAEPGR